MAIETGDEESQVRQSYQDFYLLGLSKSWSAEVPSDARRVLDWRGEEGQAIAAERQAVRINRDYAVNDPGEIRPITWTRPDGGVRQATLHLPPRAARGDGPLPVIMTVYPEDEPRKATPHEFRNQPDKYIAPLHDLRSAQLCHSRTEHRNQSWRWGLRRSRSGGRARAHSNLVRHPDYLRRVSEWFDHCLQRAE